MQYTRSMQPAPTSDRLRAALAHYRQRLAAGEDLSEDRPDLESVAEPDPNEGASLADYYELLAYDALSRSQPGYAFACLESAATLVSGGRREGLQAMAQDLLQTWFPPFETQDEVVNAVRAWARSALAARSLEDGAAQRHATRLRQGWMFRLVHTQRKDRRFRIDGLLDAFRLSGKERTLFRVLHAIHWDQGVDRAVGAIGLTVGDLLDLVSDRPAERAEWLACLDGRAPLVASRLVRLGPPAATRRRTIDLDQQVHAWVESEDWSSPELGTAVAAHQRLAFEPPQYVLADVEALNAAVERQPRSRSVLVARTPATPTLVLQAWSAQHDRPVFQLQHPVSPDELRALGREVRMRNGVLAVPARLAEETGSIHTAVSAPVVFEAIGVRSAQVTALHALATIRCSTPPREDGPALWNLALVDVGLPEQDPEDLLRALGDRALDLAEMGLISSGLVASGLPPAELSMSVLVDAVDGWLSSQA